MSKNSKKSFTLLEILVVIGIIMILVGLVTTSYSTVQKKARDAKRKSDVEQVQKALEQYYSVCGYQYPTPLASLRFSSIVCTSPSIAIMPTVPTDPRITPYLCNSCTATAYSICTNNLESESPTGFCLSNQQ